MAGLSGNAGAGKPRSLASRVARRLFVRGLPPRVGHVAWGDLARTKPISRKFGYERGGPIDRYYIERFLASHAEDVRGRVLEVKDAGYTKRLGGDRVTRSDVLDIDAGNPDATLIVDLDDAGALPDEAFDCIVLTQTLQYVFDLRGALSNLHRALAPGGVLLLTVPAITPVRTRDMTWYWNFTNLSVAKLLERDFPGVAETISFGNLRSATAFLYGLGMTELSKHDLDAADPDYQLIVAARAVKA
jgi:SAM-dependent methyltransferase